MICRELDGDIPFGITTCLKHTNADLDSFAKRHGMEPTYNEWAVSKQGSKSIKDAIVKFKAGLDSFGAIDQQFCDYVMYWH